MTQRVITACGGNFRVNVLSRGWSRPALDEAQVLGVENGRSVFVRHVQLLCNERPWVFARTIIPRSTLTGHERRLARLGARPLGAALFADPTMERGDVEIVRLTPRHALFELTAANVGHAPDEIWGRRSVFRLSGKPLLVCEMFLPEICQSCC